MRKPLIVKVAHARSITTYGQEGYCVPGMIKFFERHNLDFRSFCRHGIDSEKLLATGDAMAIEVVNVAKREARRG